MHSLSRNPLRDVRVERRVRDSGQLAGKPANMGDVCAYVSSHIPRYWSQNTRIADTYFSSSLNTHFIVYAKEQQHVLHYPWHSRLYIPFQMNRIMPRHGDCPQVWCNPGKIKRITQHIAYKYHMQKLKFCNHRLILTLSVIYVFLILIRSIRCFVMHHIHVTLLSSSQCVLF